MADGLIALRVDALFELQRATATMPRINEIVAPPSARPFAALARQARRLS